MRPPPPRPTLFPYTTLFRSDLPCRSTERQSSVLPYCQVAAGRHPNRRPCLSGRRYREDRKSTRLNSSHVESSYADVRLKILHPQLIRSRRCQRLRIDEECLS